MLCIGFQEGERIEVGGNVTVRMIRSKHGKPILGFEAPLEVKILRGAIVDRQKGGALKSQEEH